MSARILVVDDVPLNVKLLKVKLELEYFEVLTASDGEEALSLTRNHSPDILLLDIMMPGLDGYAVCRALKADPATQHIPVVMITALSDAEDRVAALECGADDFLTKPVDDVALMARVRSLVRLKRTMDEWRLREGLTREFGMLSGLATEQSEIVAGAHVVVVEDQPRDAEKLRETLEALDLVVQATGDLTQGLRLASQPDVNLVLVSVALAEADGLRLVSQLRSDDRLRQIPILLVADGEDMPRIVKGLELGANDYVMRPIDRNELKARARTQIKRRRYQERLRQLHQRSLSMALTDALTGLFNRHYLEAHLARMLARIAETKKPVAVIMIDVDKFKLVNDQHGHAVGDAVLKEVSARMSRNLRNFDLVARYGGEEFVIVMPDVSAAGAEMVADRLRQQMESDPFPLGEQATAGQAPLSLTVSMGVTWTEDPETRAEDLIGAADRALYAAKARGRNCVVADADAPVTSSGVG
jgi:two-component system cell cycle response regulator